MACVGRMTECARREFSPYMSFVLWDLTLERTVRSCKSAFGEEEGGRERETLAAEEDFKREQGSEDGRKERHGG